MEIDARGSEKSLSFCYLKIDNIFCVSRLTREGSGAFLVKAMANMIKEVGGINTKEAEDIKQNKLYGIEFDREIFALACANMLIHKEGKTN